MNSVPIPLVGEPLALDFVNTVLQPPTGPEVDLLGSRRRSRHGWHERDRLDPPVGNVDLAAVVRDLRGHVANAVHDARHGRKPTSRSLQALTAAHRGGACLPVLGWDGTGITVTRERGADPTTSLRAAARRRRRRPPHRSLRPQRPAMRRTDVPAAVPARPPPPAMVLASALRQPRPRRSRYHERHKDASR